MTFKPANCALAAVVLTATIRAGLPAVDPAGLLELLRLVELFELVGLLGRDTGGIVDVEPAPLELGVVVVAATAP